MYRQRSACNASQTTRNHRYFDAMPRQAGRKGAAHGAQGAQGQTTQTLPVTVGGLRKVTPRKCNFQTDGKLVVIRENTCKNTYWIPTEFSFCVCLFLVSGGCQTEVYWKGVGWVKIHKPQYQPSHYLTTCRIVKKVLLQSRNVRSMGVVCENYIKVDDVIPTIAQFPEHWPKIVSTCFNFQTWTYGFTIFAGW